jgi:deoxyribonuclease-4
MRVGAHVSIAAGRSHTDTEPPPRDGVSNAVWRQETVGGNCGQLFTTSPQVWAKPDLAAAEVEAFRDLTAERLEGPWVIHASYLVNLATPKDGLREKSIDALQADVDAAHTLGVEYVNVHLGAHTGAGEAAGLENAASAIDELAIPDDVTLLVESDAGAGTKLGGDFSHLAAVRDQTATDIGLCLDTAHAFAAGYDLSTPAAVDDAVEAFDDVVGLDDLHCVHLNDSKHASGTHKDEHAHIGEGYIGAAGMRAIVNHPGLRDLPFVLETPTEDGKSYAWNVERVLDLRADAPTA